MTRIHNPRYLLNLLLLNPWFVGSVAATDIQSWETTPTLESRPSAMLRSAQRKDVCFLKLVYLKMQHKYLFPSSFY